MKENFNCTHEYDDIINLPRHVSTLHPPMRIIDRAAQFSSFAALTGYDLAIKETARMTEKRIDLDEHAKVVLDEKLRIIQEQINHEPEITITYFQPDEKKLGGAYVSISGIVKKIDGYKKTVLMKDGTRISIKEIIDIRGEIVQSIDDFLL